MRPYYEKWILFNPIILIILPMINFFRKKKKCECGMIMNERLHPSMTDHPYLMCTNQNHDRDLRDKKLKRLLK